MWRTPFEVLNGELPDISHLRVFGCGAYVFIPEEVRVNKLAPRAEVMTFLGYTDGTKGFKFMRKPNNIIFHAVTALFDEYMFPHCPDNISPGHTQIGREYPSEFNIPPEDGGWFDGGAYPPNMPNIPAGNVPPVVLQGPVVPPQPPVVPQAPQGAPQPPIQPPDNRQPLWPDELFWRLNRGEHPDDINRMFRRHNPGEVPTWVLPQGPDPNFLGSRRPFQPPSTQQAPWHPLVPWSSNWGQNPDNDQSTSQSNLPVRPSGGIGPSQIGGNQPVQQPQAMPPVQPESGPSGSQAPRRSGRTRRQPAPRPGDVYGDSNPTQCQRLDLRTWLPINEDIPEQSSVDTPARGSTPTWSRPATPPADHLFTRLPDSPTDEPPAGLMSYQDPELILNRLAHEGGAPFINFLLAKAIQPDSERDKSLPPATARVHEWQYQDILQLPKAQKEEWKKACHEELESLRERRIFELTDLLKGRKVVKNRWVFDIKSDGRKKA